MRKRISALLASLFVVALLVLAACSNGAPQVSSAASGASSATSAVSNKHVIGVAVYNTADDEVLMFRDYLMNYIAAVAFEDVQFVYSNSLRSEEELLSFIDEVADMGGEGIMSFYNVDLPAEVERCAEHGMYHMVASGTVSAEDFASVENQENFIGSIGPGIEMEYNAGAAMVRNYIANKSGDRYFIVSGGAALGNEMHYQRVFGMLDALETGYGVDLGTTKDLAAVAEPTTIEVDELTVTICPGYLSRDEMRATVQESFKQGEYDVVLSTIPVAPIEDALQSSNAKVAMVDCYSQDAQLMFASGKLNYLAGKYGSLVGPSFAAMYNAVTGHAAEFRDNGKAFRIVQNFWSSPNEADFNEKYEFASNITSPAYNYEDLRAVCKEFTPDATFDDFVKLAQASSYEDAKARRSR